MGAGQQGLSAAAILRAGRQVLGTQRHSRGAGVVHYFGGWNDEVGACVPLKMSLSSGSEKPIASCPAGADLQHHRHAAVLHL